MVFMHIMAMSVVESMKVRMAEFGVVGLLGEFGVVGRVGEFGVMFQFL